MDPNLCWWAVGISVIATGFLSLLLGALHNYSLARFEDLLEGRASVMNRLRALLEHEERLLLALTALRGVFILAGMVSLTGGLIATTLRGGAPALPARWVLLGAEAVAVGAALYLAIGGVVPRSLGEGRAEAVLLRLGWVLPWIDRSTRPLTWLLSGLATVFLRVFDVRELDDSEEARDELLSAALLGEQEGVIDEATMDVIENLIEFREADVSEVMTPRIDIVSVDVEASMDEVLDVALEHKHSRLPVSEGGLDRIVGILMVKDLLQVSKDPGLTPRELVRKPFFVPETKRVAELLKELRTRKFHMAIVADEYGGTAGLVTIEDLIEEIIGEIDDEHDEEERPLRRLSDSMVDADAKLHIDEFNETFGTKLPEDEEVETLGGFIALRLGRIPSRGDRVELNGTSLEVTEADERRVRRVLVRLGAKAPA